MKVRSVRWTSSRAKPPVGKYDVFAVKGISFDIKEGEIFSLLGPNGARRKTIISIVVAAEDMTGHNGFSVKALPHEELREALRRFGRVADGG